MYRVFRKTAGSGWKIVDTLSGTTCTDTEAKSGTTYTYTVRCITEDEMDYTSRYDKNGLTVTYLSQPSVSSVANSASGVTIKWGKVTGAAKYRIFRKTGSGGWTKLADTVDVTFTDAKAVNGTTYSYTVRCLSSDGSTLVSSYDNTGKQIVRLTAPTISSVTNSASKAITVKWNRNTKVTGYQITYKTGTTSKTVTVSGNATVSKVISGLTKDKSYTVYVRSYKTVSGVNYYSAWSSAKTVKITK
jgi:hypothetical protein